MQPNNGKPPQMIGHNQHPLHLQNHLNQTVLNPTLNQPVQMIQSGFDHVPPSVNVNGVGVKPNEQLVYYSGQPHSGVMQQRQYTTNTPNAVSGFFILYFFSMTFFTTC